MIEFITINNIGLAKQSGIPRNKLGELLRSGKSNILSEDEWERLFNAHEATKQALLRIKNKGLTK